MIQDGKSTAELIKAHGLTRDSNLFAGGGETGALMAAMDWRKTPLGPISTWPQNLKTCIRIVLTSRQPMFVWWGDELLNLYNDAYRSIVGGKHPGALGQPARVVWSEIWDAISPRAASAMERNEGTYDEALLLIMERYGYPEETYYTFSYSPVPNDRGGTGGILCANTDDTQRIIGERQLSLLSELGSQTADARNWQDACRLATKAFPTDQRDLCFTLIYLHDPSSNSIFLAGKSGLQDGLATAERVDIADESIWPIGTVLNTRETKLVKLGRQLAIPPLPPWDRACHEAAVLPLTLSGSTGLTGVLVVGLNPYRRFDSNYEGFLSLVAGQLSASIANAQAYEQEKKRAEMLATLDRAKTTFFSNVSHEFRTPLTLMLGPTEDALNSAEKSLKGTELETVHRNQLRLLKLVNTLLEFSRLEAGRIKASFRPTDLAQLTSELASVFRSAVERAGLSLNIDCKPLRSGIYVDRDMWEKIVLNLLSNALKSTFDGAISVRLHDAGDHCELSVRDTGTGIAEEELPHLFERFRRIEGARRRTHEGSGIGLALVHELVKMHGGNINVVSKLGRGTTFTVTLPYGSAHLSADRVGVQSATDAHSSGRTAIVEEALSWLPQPLSGKVRSQTLDAFDLGAGNEDEALQQDGVRFRVLLADDNRDMRAYVCNLLSSRFEVQTAENGRVALNMALQNPPDVVLSDVMMPEMDGFQLLAGLRRQTKTKTVPVILLSARAGEESRVEGMEAGADDYLIKPFTARELLARVEAHVKIAQFRREAYHREAELQEELAQAKQLAADAVANISDGFFTLDRDWRFTYVNAAGERMTAAAGNSDEILGKNLWQTMPDLFGSDIDLQYRRCMEQRIPVEFETAYGNRWYAIRAYPSPKDAITIYVADVSARKKAEESLRMKQEHLLLTQRSAKIGSWELDMEEEDLTISPEFAEIAGLPSYVSRLRYSEFLNALFFSTDRNELAKSLDAALRGKKEFNVELRLKRPDDSVRLVVSRGKVFYNQGKPVVLGVLIDITPKDSAFSETARRRARKPPKARSRNKIA